MCKSPYLSSSIQSGTSIPPITVATIALTTLQHSFYSALKEFFDPVKTNDPRTDFFAVYRKKSGEFDRDYVEKYDGDLNTSLIFVGDTLPLFFVQSA